MKKEKKSLNTDWLFKGFIVGGFAIYFIILLTSGEVIHYVHPRLIIYLKICSAIMLLMSIYSIYMSQKTSYNKTSFFMQCRRYLVFIIPLVLAIALVLDVQHGSAAHRQQTQALAYINEISHGTSKLKENNTIVVDNSNFLYSISEVANNYKKYQGKGIRISGFIYRNPTMNKDQFVIARMLMVCCAADASPVGLLSSFNDSQFLEEKGWYDVSGIISSGTYNGKETAVICVKSLKRIEAPVEQYVYPE